MSYIRINPPIMVTNHSASNVTINGGANYYADLGRSDAVSGYVPIGVVFNLVSMTNFVNLVPGSLQTNGANLWVRVFNSQSGASTGSWTATMYWVKV